jgi:hypothetical protein
LKSGVGVGVTFFRSNKQRIDLDNLVKAVLDAANGIAFVDDVQVVELAARIDLDPKNPRTVILIEPKATSMPRGDEADEKADCLTCGKAFSFRRYESKPDGQLYCSRECRGRQPRDCRHCERTFLPSAARQQFCGKKCAAQAKETKAKIARNRRKAELPNCCLCDQGLHRKGAILCRDCWLKEAPKGKSKDEIIRVLEETGRLRPRKKRRRRSP